jgi:mono/diheme cytochrome c family protein
MTVVARIRCLRAFNLLKVSPGAFALVYFAMSGQSVYAQDANPAQGATEPSSSPSAAQLSDQAWIEEGRVKFVHTCSYCHGEAGDAGKNKPFRDHLNWDVQAIHDTISDGRVDGANIMPSWKGSISDEEIWKIVSYIHSLAGKPK